MLIAKDLAFSHPVTGKKITISVPFDEQWQHVFKQLAWQD